MNDAISPSGGYPEHINITLARHGETFQNRHHVVQGQDPTYGRLTPEGIHQAQLLGEALADKSFDIVYCSPLERAVLTMSQILVPRNGDRTLPIVFATDLKEINLGELHGVPHEDWKAAMDGHDPMTFKAGGGESWLDVQERATRYFMDTVVKAGHDKVLIVAHGGVNRGILASLTGLDMATAWLGAGQGCPQENACINEMVINREGTLLEAVVNDSMHLEGGYGSATPGQRWIPENKSWEVLGAPGKGKTSFEFNPYG